MHTTASQFVFDVRWLTTVVVASRAAQSWVFTLHVCWTSVGLFCHLSGALQPEFIATSELVLIYWAA